MRLKGFRGRTKLALALLAVAGVGSAAAYRVAQGSDHQDTPDVELSPRADVNDVYAFPGSASDRIVLVMTTSSPITPAASATASFDPDLLYQLKIDNTGDGVEDMVLQFTFEGTGTNQTVHMRGPVAPPMKGMLSRISPAAETMSGTINTVLGSPSGVQLFAGIRDDPFFLDLEQFFCIIPDRRPVGGALAGSCTTGVAGSFRSAGQAVDYLNGYNALALVVELPKSMLTGTGTGRIGVWGTTSR
jgi:hypothetical protein